MTQEATSGAAALWGTCEHHAPGIGPGDCETKDCHLDPGIYEIVWGLWEAGVELSSSCQGGGPPHSQWQRLVRFGHDDATAGERVLRVANALHMPVWQLIRKQWPESVHFWWELWFKRDVPWSRNGAEASR